MALKINHAETIGGIQLASLSSIHSMTSTKALSFSTDAKSLEKKKKTIEDNGYNKFNLNRPKFPNLLATILSHEEIYSNYDRSNAGNPCFSLIEGKFTSICISEICEIG